MVAEPSIWRGHRVGLSTLRRALHYPQTRIGLVVTVAVVLLALIGPLVAPHSPTEFVAVPFVSRSADALLGADALGRDVLSRVLWGGRSVLWMSFAATLVGVGVGVVVGLGTGYSQGRLSESVMRLLDLVLAFPQLVLVLLFVSLLGSSTWLIVALTALAWVPGMARVTRGMVIEEMEREYTQSAEAIGLSRRRILLAEMLPNMATPLLVQFALRLTWSIVLIAGLSFLGFGIQPPNADWGLMISENRNGLVTQPWATISPIVLIGLFAIGTNLIAEGFARTMAGIDRLGGVR